MLFKLICDSNPAVLEKLKISQYEHAIKSFHDSLSLLNQSITILVIVNATIIGYAISSKIAGVFFIGSLFPIIILYLYNIILRGLIPIIYFVITLEDKHKEPRTDYFGSTFFSFIISPEYVDLFRKINTIEDSHQRILKLRKIPPPKAKPTFLRPILIFISLGQLTAPFIFHFVLGWKIF